MQPLDPPPPSPSFQPYPPHRLSHPSFELGWVLEQGFTAYARNLPAFLAMAVVIYLPLIVYAALVGNPISGEVGVDAVTRNMLLFTMVITVGSFLLSQVLASAVVFSVVEHLAGRRTPIGRALTVGLTRMLPTLAVALLVAVCAGLAALLLIFPGLMVLCAYYVAVPVSVVERPGIGGALSRSGDLTRGHRWSIFVLFIVTMAIGTALGIGLDRLLIDKVSVNGLEVVHPDDWRLYVLLQVGTQLVSGALAATLSATAYVALRNSKEGIGAEELSKVFA